eukprot:10017188-Prorocentrum_lima.AAC.1
MSIPSDSPFADDQYQWFKNKWEAIRAAVPIEQTTKFTRKGELTEGAYVEIHQTHCQPMTQAIKKK